MSAWRFHMSPAACLLLAAAHLPAQPAASTRPAQQPAQQPARTVQYVYLRGTDTLGVETLTLTDTSIVAVQSLRGAPRIAWTQYRQGTALGALALKAYAPNAPIGAPPVQQGVIRMQGDSARLEFVTGGRTVNQAALTKPGAFALVNSSVIHAALVSQVALRMKQTNVALFLSTGGQTISATAIMRGDTMVMNIGGVETRVLADANGLPREAIIPSQNARVVRSTSTIDAAGRIDYGAPPGAPYTTEQVRIPTGRGYELGATFTRPVLNRTVAVVVTISGSGQQERDSRVSIVPGYAPFRDIADSLARRGIATVRFDDRGVGESGGLDGVSSATSADFADDVRSVVAWLGRRPDIDTARIALVGHSEGGMIAPMIAAGSPTLSGVASGAPIPRVRALALLAGPAYTGRRIMLFQNEQAIAAAPRLTEAQRDSVRRTVPAGLDALAKSNRWMGYFMSHDPLLTAKRVKQPVLILQGDTDHQITPEQADTLAAAFRAGGNRAVTVKHFPATNHLMLPDPSGVASGYGGLKDTHVRREVLGALADWLVLTLR